MDLSEKIITEYKMVSLLTDIEKMNSQAKEALTVLDNAKYLYHSDSIGECAKFLKTLYQQVLEEKDIIKKQLIFLQIYKCKLVVFDCSKDTRPVSLSTLASI